VSQTKVCQCLAGSKRKCDPCAERDFDLLLQKCKSDPKYQSDGTIIAPSPGARETTGYHRPNGRKVGAPGREPAITEADARRISERVAAYQVPEGEALWWCCSSCGPLTKREMPLVDESGKGYCPRVECGGTVKLTAK